ncbi:GIY-YIG nuclease family protein [Brevundimonas sp.]
MDHERTERANSRHERFKHFMRVASVRPDNPRTASLDAVWRARLDTKEDRKERQRLAEKALGIALAFGHNGPGFAADRYLRNFLNEYNNRTFLTYGDQQPSSFSVVSDFLEPEEKIMVLRLIEEQMHLFDLSEFLEFHTGPESNSSPLTDLPELVSYEFSQSGNPAFIELPDLSTYRFGGFCLVRNGSSVSAMAILGEPTTGESEETGPDQLDPEKPFLKDIEIDRTPEDFFGIEGYAPLIFLINIDAETRAYTSRFVLQETKTSFNVIYDDPYTEEYRKQAMPENFEEFSALNKQRMKSYDSLFLMILSLFDLPAYFDKFEDDIRLERHPTALKLERPPRRILMALASAPRDLLIRHRSVSHLRRYNLKAEVRDFAFGSEGLHRETSGHWKPVALGATGLDKHGHEVVGKTWVTKDLTWYQRSDADGPRGEIAVGGGGHRADDAGYIYVMRNPAHPRNVVKIGWTGREPDQRADDLSSTSGQIDKFLVVESWRVRDPRYVESRIHAALAKNRVTDSREFFSGTYKDIRRVIISHLEGYELSGDY